MANGFYQRSNLQGVCVPILVFVSINERLLQLFTPLIERTHIWIQPFCIDRFNRVGSRHLPPGGIFQEKYLRGCSQCCRLSDFPCPFFPVSLVSHIHKRARSCSSKTTSTTIYITLHTLYTFTLSSTQNLMKWLHHI